MDGTVNLNNGTVNFTDNVLRVQLPETLIKIADITDSAPSPTLQITNIDYSQPIEVVALGGTSIIDSTKITFSSRHSNIVTPANPTAGDFIGGFSARAYETNNADYVPSSIFGFQVDPDETVAADTIKGKIVFTNNAGTGSSPVLKYLTFNAAGQLAVNKQTATANLDVEGNAKLTEELLLGNMTTAERDALTASNGMMLYNTTTNKFQGYENGSWVNLI